MKLAKSWQKAEETGIVRRSNSQRASALHMVPKQFGLWRQCEMTMLHDCMGNEFSH